MSEIKKNDVNEISRWEVSSLIPYEKNSKIHTDEQIADIAALIVENGFNYPITVDENGVIISGHGRRLAAMSLGRKYVPVIVKRGLSEEQKRAQRIADNMVARGGNDEEILSNELLNLAEDGFDMSLLGMAEGELTDIIGSDVEFDFSDMDFDKAESDDLADVSEEISEESQLKRDIDASEESRANLTETEYKERFEILVECSGEEQQQEIYMRLTEEGFLCRVQTG